MHAVETVLLVLLLGALTGIVARYIRAIPLPLIQIALGALIAWPQAGLHIAFDPELFLLLFIPPLLFADGWRIPKREFFALAKPILLLALGLVLLTVLGLGYLIHWMIPEIPLTVAFALAAVVSPTDAVAVSAITRNLGMPENHACAGRRVAAQRRIGPGGAEICSCRHTDRRLFLGRSRRIHLDGRGRPRCGRADRLGIQPCARHHHAPPGRCGGHADGAAAGVAAVCRLYRGREDRRLRHSGRGGSRHCHHFADLERSSYISERMQTAGTWSMVEAAFNGAIFLLLGLQLPSIIGVPLHQAGHDWWILVGYVAAISLRCC